MKLEEIARLLKDRRLYRVAEVTGLSYQTIRTIVNGTNKNPTIETVRLLEDYLNGKSNPVCL